MNLLQLLNVLYSTPVKFKIFFVHCSPVDLPRMFQCEICDPSVQGGYDAEYNQVYSLITPQAFVSVVYSSTFSTIVDPLKSLADCRAKLTSDEYGQRMHGICELVCKIFSLVLHTSPYAVLLTLMVSYGTSTLAGTLKFHPQV